MVEPKIAVQKCADYYRNVSGDSTSPLLIEEIELSSNKKHWNVTLSHPNPNASSLSVLYGNTDNRLFKAFVVDASTGEVLSMKVKKIT